MIIAAKYSKSLLSVFLVILFLSLEINAQSSKKFYIDKNFNTDKIVASVDSINITSEEFFLSYEYGPAFTKKSSDSRKKHLEYMINEKLLALEGYSTGEDTTEEISGMINEFVNDLSTEEMFKNEILPKVVADEKEIDSVITQKKLQLEIKWIYSNSEDEIKDMIRQMKNGAMFDSLFTAQFKDSVVYDDRYMKTDRYQLGNKNSLLAGIIDSLKAGEVSIPVHTADGWYILKLENISYNNMITETEYEKLRQEAENAVIKKEMDQLSDEYVNNLMIENNPVIKKEVFNFLRFYLAKYYLDEKKFTEWNLEEKFNSAMDKMNTNAGDKILVSLKQGGVKLNEFLIWYRNRSGYIKLNQNSFNDFSQSVEKMIWRMVRDNLLSKTAVDKNYDESPVVVKQSGWWRDKITGSAVRNKIMNSAMLESGDTNQDVPNGKGSDAEKLQAAFQEKLLHKLLSLKKKYKIKINEKELAAVPVTTESDMKAIEFYTVKTGGLIPRTPYPTINHEWVNWE